MFKTLEIGIRIGNKKYNIGSGTWEYVTLVCDDCNQELRGNERIRMVQEIRHLRMDTSFPTKLKISY